MIVTPVLQNAYDAFAAASPSPASHTRSQAASSRLGDVLSWSLKGLDGTTQDMFFDTTVLRGELVSQVQAAWQGMYRLSRLEVEDRTRLLQNSSLVKVVDGWLWVHDVIHALAKEHVKSDRERQGTRAWSLQQLPQVGCCSSAALYAILCRLAGL